MVIVVVVTAYPYPLCAVNALLARRTPLQLFGLVGVQVWDEMQISELICSRNGGEMGYFSKRAATIPLRVGYCY